MRHFVTDVFAIAALVGAEAWFLHGYYDGKPEWESGIAFVTALGVILAKDPISRAIQSKREESKSHDAYLFGEFSAILPQVPAIRFLKEHDFGDSFSKDPLQPLYDFVREWEGVDKEFIDSVIEERRKNLYLLAEKLVLEISRCTVPIRGDYYSVYSDAQRALGEVRPQDVIEDARVLNELAESFVSSYEDFFRFCRSRLIK